MEHVSFSSDCWNFLNPSTHLRLDYTVLQKYVHIGLKQNHLKSTALDIITRMLDNAAFVCVHVVGRFSKDFAEVCGLRIKSRVSASGWMDDNSTVHGIMKRNVKRPRRFIEVFVNNTTA